jgi:hypothetical protein
MVSTTAGAEGLAAADAVEGLGLVQHHGLLAPFRQRSCAAPGGSRLPDRWWRTGRTARSSSRRSAAAARSGHPSARRTGRRRRRTCTGCRRPCRPPACRTARRPAAGSPRRRRRAWLHQVVERVVERVALVRGQVEAGAAAGVSRAARAAARPPARPGCSPAAAAGAGRHSRGRRGWPGRSPSAGQRGRVLRRLGVRHQHRDAGRAIGQALSQTSMPVDAVCAGRAAARPGMASPLGQQRRAFRGRGAAGPAPAPPVRA